MLSLSFSSLPYWVVLLFLSKNLVLNRYPRFGPDTFSQSEPIHSDTPNADTCGPLYFCLDSNTFFRLYSLQDWDLRLARIIHTITERALCTVHPPFSHCIYFYFKCYIDTPKALTVFRYIWTFFSICIIYQLSSLLSSVIACLPWL